ncbi:MAG: thioredoxin family protein [Phototrophicaceae bacterium]
MVERLLIAGILFGVGFAAYAWMRRQSLRQVAQITQRDSLLTDTRDGIPTVVYFTTPTCAPCQYAQKPALAKLKTELGEGIQVIQVDATEQPDVAERWQVQTVPTTFILDADGAPRQVNYGVADFDTLKRQIAAL